MSSKMPLLSLPQTSPPPHRTSNPSLRFPPSPRFAVASAAAARSEDNYHATLEALNSKGRRTPRKSLGQHYMLNSSVNDQLCEVAGIGDGDVVLEIGPGTGSLTNALINAGATVLAVEKDPHMAMLVKDRFGCIDRLTILQEDFTRCHISSHMSSLLDYKKSIGTKIEYAKVDAAVVQFKLKQVPDYPLVSSTKSFFSMVNAAFNSKRKMLRKSLQHLCPSLEIEAALRSLGLPITARPEELTMDEFVALHNLIVGVALISS